MHSPSSLATLATLRLWFQTNNRVALKPFFKILFTFHLDLTLSIDTHMLSISVMSRLP